MKRLLAAASVLVLLACSGSRTATKGEAGAGPNLPPAAALEAADPREAELARLVVELLERQHLLDRPLDDALSRAAFDQYVKRIDPGKAFLLAADVERLRAHATRIDDQLKSGRLELAHDGARVMAGRREVVARVVAELLASPLDHTDEEWLELDPDKLAFAADERALRDRWRQRLELEVLERVALMEDQLARAAPPAGGKPAPAPSPGDEPDADVETIRDIPATPEGRDERARADLAARYAGRFTRLSRPDPLDAAADLINAVTAAFDPHTNYLPPAAEANFDIQMSGQLEGIGAVLREHDHYIEVVELVPGGAAARQGVLAPGDLITAVAQDGQKPVDVADMRLDKVVGMVRGKAGTVVHLTIQKPTGEVQVLSITREVVVVEDTYARGAVLERKGDRRGYGYVHLPSFYGGRGARRTAAADVRALLAEAADRKVAGVVLDLRGNGGGLLDDAIELTGLLIDRGPVVQTQRRSGKTEVLRDTEAGVTFDGPVVVLVDRFTASASEIVAGALQDYRRAVIVGTAPTHGKGTVQVLADLDRAAREPLGDLKLTIQQYFRPSGGSVQWRGVVPDVLLPDPAGHLETGERYLDNAIPWTEIDAVEHAALTPDWTLEALVAASARRVATHDVLSRVATATDLMRRRRADTRVPLARDAWAERRATRRAELEAAMPELTKAPARLTVGPLAAEASPPDERIKTWRAALTRDPWLDEAVAILAELAGPPPTPAPAPAPAKRR